MALNISQSISQDGIQKKKYAKEGNIILSIQSQGPDTMFYKTQNDMYSFRRQRKGWNFTNIMQIFISI